MASAGPEDNNLEVKLYWDKIYGVLVQEMENILDQRRVVWQGRLQLKLKSQTPQLCETRVTAVE